MGRSYKSKIARREKQMNISFWCYSILVFCMNRWHDKERMKAIPQLGMERKLNMFYCAPKVVSPIANRPAVKINIQAHN
jgi:hypothetical protein